MSEFINRAGLSVAGTLVRFLETKALPGTGVAPSLFWKGVSDIFQRFAPENRTLVAQRDLLQKQIDAWHQSYDNGAPNPARYRAFLSEIGYLAEEPQPFKIDTRNVDDELAKVAGPQLVVPVLNARFLLNAANARWGSLYDALYGTDAILPIDNSAKGYDPERGAKVIGWTKRFLDAVVPLEVGSHQFITGWSISDGRLFPRLRDPSQFVGWQGDAQNPNVILFKNHGLHIQLVLDRAHPIGKTDPSGLADVILEAALTTIVDLEDSIAAVDAEDKVAAYSNLFGVIKGDLSATFEKNGRSARRKLRDDLRFRSADGKLAALPGRSLLLVRNVGLLLTTPAVVLQNGEHAPEGILDAIVTSLVSMHDLKRNGRYINSRNGCIYIVKPKLHGPDEAGFTDRLFDAVEDLLGLERHTIKVGVMDEERHTSANLAAAIRAVRHRIMFINTGFLDRTGDEIHTSMRAGAMVPKTRMKDTAWIKAYEQRNVAIGLACGFSGKAQIGKGMWAAPDQMSEMLASKIGHLEAGASTAWVPSPTAATLHATHYHAVDVFARQSALMHDSPMSLDELLTIPVAACNWTQQQIQDELDNNIQGILGYVVRWIDQGIGCSKVPDIHDVALMEDRATLRISSQHVANWLLHGVCRREDVEETFLRMAAKVDAQNAGDPHYRPMSADPHESIAFQAARALVFEGVVQPNGYTEPLLHAFRAKAKSREICRQDVARS